MPRIGSAIVGQAPYDCIFSKVLPTRTYCPAGNTVAGIFLALLNGEAGEIYNIGLDKPEINVVELIALRKKECKIQVPYELVEPEDVYTDEPLRRCPDITKARNKLEYLTNFH